MQIQGELTNLAIREAGAPQTALPTTNAAQVRNAVHILNAGELLGYDREMRFSTDPQSRLGIVQVVSRSTGDVIAQIPSELVLDLADAVKTNH